MFLKISCVRSTMLSSSQRCIIMRYTTKVRCPTCGRMLQRLMYY